MCVTVLCVCVCVCVFNAERSTQSPAQNGFLIFLLSLCPSRSLPLSSASHRTLQYKLLQSIHSYDIHIDFPFGAGFNLVYQKFSFDSSLLLVFLRMGVYVCVCARLCLFVWKPRGPRTWESRRICSSVSPNVLLIGLYGDRLGALHTLTVFKHTQTRTRTNAVVHWLLEKPPFSFLFSPLQIGSVLYALLCALYILLWSLCV